MDEVEGKKFLEFFPVKKRATVMNVFLAAVRGGARTIADVVVGVKTDSVNALANQWTSAGKFETYSRILDHLDTDAAAGLARYCLWWESLSREEKEIIRRPKQGEYVKAHMAIQPPTEKQLSYLRRLGCRKVPTSRLEASQLIEGIKR